MRVKADELETHRLLSGAHSKDGSERNSSGGARLRVKVARPPKGGVDTFGEPMFVVEPFGLLRALIRALPHITLSTGTARLLSCALLPGFARSPYGGKGVERRQ